MAIKNKKYNYYKLNVGFFPDIVKLCFDNTVFQQILKDHDVTLKANALDCGIGETHVIGNDKDAIIIIVLGPDVVSSPLHELADTISHEVSHAVDHLADHIGEEDGLKGETRAYLTGHLVSQIFKITLFEKDKNARARDRESLKEASKIARRKKLQMAINNIGSKRSDSPTEQEVLLRGTQDNDRKGF